MHLLGCPEEQNNLLRHGNGTTGSGVATGACITLLHRERTKATKLNPVPSRESIGNGTEDRADDDLDITRIQMRVVACELPYQFGLDHGAATWLFKRGNSRRCQRAGGASSWTKPVLVEVWCSRMSHLEWVMVSNQCRFRRSSREPIFVIMALPWRTTWTLLSLKPLSLSRNHLGTGKRLFRRCGGMPVVNGIGSTLRYRQVSSS